MKSIKVAIADDQALFRKGIQLLLGSYPNMDLIISAKNGKELLAEIANTPPEVVLLDLNMPEMDGLEATEKIKTLYPSIKIILLSTYDEEQLIHHMMKMGANGYLLKNEEPHILKEAIEAVVEKDFYFNDYVSKALLHGLQKKPRNVKPWKGSLEQQLSKREQEVLELICQEYTSHEVAEQLFLSRRTVENHRKSLLHKTGARNTAGLILFAVKNQLIDTDKFGIVNRK